MLEALGEHADPRARELVRTAEIRTEPASATWEGSKGRVEAYRVGLGVDAAQLGEAAATPHLTDELVRAAVLGLRGRGQVDVLEHPRAQRVHRLARGGALRDVTRRPGGLDEVQDEAVDAPGGRRAELPDRPGRQVALALAGPAGLGQDLAHPIKRECPGDHAKADVIAEADAGGQAGRSTGHGCRSSEGKRQYGPVTSLCERYCS